MGFATEGLQQNSIHSTNANYHANVNNSLSSKYIS